MMLTLIMFVLLFHCVNREPQVFLFHSPNAEITPLCYHALLVIENQ